LPKIIETFFIWGRIGEVNAGAGIPPRNIPIAGKTSSRRNCPTPTPPHATEVNGNRVYQHFGGNITDMLVILKALY